MEAAIDRCILRLISSCCNGIVIHTYSFSCNVWIHMIVKYVSLDDILQGDKLVRATELARLLTMEKSIKGAIKLVSTLKLPILAERFNDILEVTCYHIHNFLLKKVVFFS